MSARKIVRTFSKDDEGNVTMKIESGSSASSCSLREFPPRVVKLLEAAFSVMHHDSDPEIDEGAAYEWNLVGRKFEKILKENS